MPTRLQKVREALEMLHQLMGWELPSPATTEEVESFEDEHGIQLPAEYRSFLLEVMKGGPGPDYGLTPLGAEPMPRQGFARVSATITYDDGAGGGSVSAGTGPRPSLPRGPELARPFPLTREWQPLTTEGELRASPLGADEHPYDGSLHLVDKGCGYMDLLVVTGPRAGEVWTDYTAGDGAIYPAGSFLDWYEQWLYDAARSWLLAKLRGDDPDAAERAKAELPAYVELFEAERDAKPDDIHHWTGLLEVLSALEREQDLATTLAAAEGLSGAEPVLEPIYRRLHATVFARAEADSPEPSDELLGHPLTAVRLALASNPSCPADALARLAADASAEVRTAVASNPAADPAALGILIGLADRLRTEAQPDAVFQLELAAAHQHATPAQLRQLADLPLPEQRPCLESLVLRAAALNRSAPVELLTELAEHPAPWVRHAVALNPSTPLTLIERLANDEDPTVAGDVGYSPQASPDLLRSLATRNSKRARASAATNPNTPLPILLELAGELDGACGYGLARNPARHPELVALLDYHHYRAENLPRPACEPPELASLPYDATAWRALAANATAHPAYPLVLLVRAIRSGGRMAAYDAGAHPWIDHEHLEVIAEDKYDYAAMRAAEHRLASDALLVRLAEDRSGLVRGGVAANPRCPPALLETLSRDPGKDARAGAARNPKLPSAALARLATDPEHIVRLVVAQHLDTPPELLAALATDANPHVRKFVAVHPSHPPAAVETMLGDDAAVVCKNADWRLRYEAATGHPPRLR